MAQFGFDLKELEQKSLLRMEFIQLSAQSNSVSAAIEQISRAIEEFHPTRVVIDSASSLALAVQGGRSDVLFMLQNLFAKLGAYEDVTSILVAEMSSGTDQFGNGVEEFISDGIAVIRLRTRGKTKVKSIEVRKMRGTSHSTKSVLLEINENGVEVDPEIELTS